MADEKTSGSARVNHGRRRLLLAGGLGAVTWVVLRGAPKGDPARPSGIGGRRSGPTSTTTTTPPIEPPVLEGAGPAPGADHVHELVLAGGRVIDPQTGFDQVAHVGIDGDVITGLSLEPLEGSTSFDVSGLVVSPGFIDVLSYEPNEYGIWFKIADGVTTNLGMHGINSSSAAEFFAVYEGRTPCHFGGAYDNSHMRTNLTGLGVYDTAVSSQVDQLAQAARTGFDEGWIGVNFEPEYTPGVDTAEMVGIGRVAAERNMPLFFHVRYSDADRNDEALAEVLDIARQTGAAVHVEHIASTGGTFTMRQSLDTLAAARAEGIDVTADAYPYTSWATYIGAARFGVDPETGATAVERFGIDYDDLQIVGTPERLTEARFNELRAGTENPLVAAVDAIPAADVEDAMRSEFVMIGSDAILEPGDNNHPRSTGCFSRTLGTYVREKQTITLQQALAKMTILPAKRLESGAPVMKMKGRLQRGAHADITVFDPATVADRSTLENPAQESAGIHYVVVAGQVVKDPDGLKRDRLPGHPIRGNDV